MGRVYLSHTPGGRAVAVKVIRPELAENAEFRKRFQAEVASASRVHGLYTAPVVDSDTEGSVPWCATAYVPGPSLADAIRDHGPLPVDTVLRLIAGVAEALQAVHREGIVHRDLKPSNVLLADDGPRVIDFGVARAADATSVTQSGMALGTVAYMAPEQALGGEAAPSADVFALGQTAVFASTGRGAFGDGDAHAVLYRVVHEQPDLGQVPDEIRELVARCLRKPAAERPSVEEVIRSVQTIQAHRGDEARYTSGAWLPGELAARIAARAEGAHQAQAQAQAQAEPEQTPSAHGSGSFGAAGSGGFGAADSGGFGAAGSGGGFGPRRLRRFRPRGGLLPHLAVPRGATPCRSAPRRPVPRRAARAVRDGKSGRTRCVHTNPMAPAAGAGRRADLPGHHERRGPRGPALDAVRSRSRARRRWSCRRAAARPGGRRQGRHRVRGGGRVAVGAESREVPVGIRLPVHQGVEEAEARQVRAAVRPFGARDTHTGSRTRRPRPRPASRRRPRPRPRSRTPGSG
ncbi:serine/threonine-protein kinase [Streptomyces sp. GLT-R25]